jgi:hypothetical protein
MIFSRPFITDRSCDIREPATGRCDRFDYDEENAGGFITMMAGAGVLATGAILLGVGCYKRSKWLEPLDNINARERLAESRTVESDENGSTSFRLLVSPVSLGLAVDF